MKKAVKPKKQKLLWGEETHCIVFDPKRWPRPVIESVLTPDPKSPCQVPQVNYRYPEEAYACGQALYRLATSIVDCSVEPTK